MVQTHSVVPTAQSSTSFQASGRTENRTEMRLTDCSNNGRNSRMDTRQANVNSSRQRIPQHRNMLELSIGKE